MRRASRSALAALILLSVPCEAQGRADRSAELKLTAVLKNIASAYPKLLALQQKEGAARAELRSARGLWDPKLKLKGSSSQLKGERLEYGLVELRQQTPLWGAELFAGYRLGLGAFPSYKEELATLHSGELRAGLELPLLAGRATDEGRAAISKNAATRELARWRSRLALIEVERSATEAYWDWVKASRLLAIQRELLTMAQGRAEGLKAQVELGSKPPITLVDNERLILERSAEVISARRKLSESAYKLSLFFRDPELLTPIPPTAEMAPPQLKRAWRPDLPPHQDDERQLIERHPLLKAQRSAVQAAKVDLELAEALLGPRLNLSSFVAQDLIASVADERSKLAKPELGVGLSFELPIGLNKASGKRASAFAKQSAEELKLRGLQDQLLMTLRQARVELQADYEQALLAHKQVKVAYALVQGERLKLQEGASDLILLNIRELAYAKAEASEVKLIAAYHKAWATYLFSKGVLISASLKAHQSPSKKSVQP